MKFIAFITSLLTFLNFETDCGKLTNGTYVVRHTPNNGELDYQFIIKDKVYITLINSTVSVKGRLNWIDECLLKLEPYTPPNTDTSMIGKRLHDSFGEHCLQIKKTIKDTTFFRTTWTGNLNITINEGYFLKVK